MAIPSSLTLNFDALLTTTLQKWLSKNAVDQILTSNAFFNALRSRPNGYKTLDSLGERARAPLRYGLVTPDSYGDYDVLKLQPSDGLTTAFYEWRQMATPVMISGMELAKNSGEAQIINLLEEKVEQAMDGAKEWVAKTILQGQAVNDGTSLTTPYTSPNNGSTFVEPLFHLVRVDPTASAVIGNINQSTYDWWRNRTLNSTATNFAGFLNELNKAWIDCGKGTGGYPDLNLCDENVFLLYQKALTAFHQNPSYRFADIPFENLAFKGKPLVWDEFMPDAAGGSTTLNPLSGTWVMLNTQTFQLQAYSKENFTATPFEKPTNQDAKVSMIMWKGALVCTARRKNGVIHGIDTTLTS